VLRELLMRMRSPSELPGDRFEPAHTDAVAICRLLPLLERIDPHLGREALWRALSLRLPRPTTQWLDEETDQADLALITMLVRYDRILARAMLEPLVARLNELSVGPSEFCAGGIVGAAAAIDPAWGEQLIERLPAPPDSRTNRAMNWARLMLARVIGAHDDLRWDMIGYTDLARYDSWY
jgi:hypothetical protein